MSFTSLAFSLASLNLGHYSRAGLLGIPEESSKDEHHQMIEPKDSSRQHNEMSDDEEIDHHELDHPELDSQETHRTNQVPNNSTCH
ncbi:hypothetical protein THRCLA_22707 [Thraustotheca clavata]|uniref:Uncharacterized protein n=1 Tax=Thraustotheca clavata TaxID=74557 RepID=A0A1V9YUI7_9STRA|nr:hypothetical protein THRCLA_22707 [Thraustotheca clavata]